jgi:hypothetical protein
MPPQFLRARAEIVVLPDALVKIECHATLLFVNREL